MSKPAVRYDLYLVTDRQLMQGRELADCVEQAILGGTTLIQLREKECSTLDFFTVAGRVKQIADKYGVPLIINDRLDIAQAVNAEGLHIGQSDLPLPVARAVAGKDKIIGVSVFSVCEALLAEQQGADYLGVGAVFPTATKSDARAVTLDELWKIKQAVRIPVVAIGGITHANAAAVLQTGVDGIAVVSALLGTPDVQKAARTFQELISAAVKK